MTPEEAVRIVRESMLPYNKECSPRTVGKALETVLAALEEMKRDLTASHTTQGILQLQHSTMRADCDNRKRRAEKAERERDEARAEVERLRDRLMDALHSHALDADADRMSYWSERAKSAEAALAAERERANHWMARVHTADCEGSKAVEEAKAERERSERLINAGDALVARLWLSKLAADLIPRWEAEAHPGAALAAEVK